MEEENLELIILICIVIPLLSYFYFANKKRTREYLAHQAAIIEALLEEVNKFHLEITELSSQYIDQRIIVQILKDYEQHYSKLKKLTDNQIVNNPPLHSFKQIYSDIHNWKRKQNEKFFKAEAHDMEAFFADIDGKSLDEQQKIAVMTNEENTLVLAGAGSGKTLTISAKVKYLVERLGIHSDEILLISFTKASADEMTERIRKKLGISITAMTFHKLGLEIITSLAKARPEISDNALTGTINRYFSENVVSNTKVLQNIVYFYSMYLAVPKNLEEFDTLGEFQQDQSSNNLETLRSKIENSESKLKQEHRTLKLERVRSLEEVIIANYLYLNGINYEYEAVYPYKGDRYRKAYRPDFYLPDYDIYIEHFGITRDYRTPWLSKIEEEKYIEGIHWKRQLHDDNKTTLVETYSYLNKEGTLLRELERCLKAQGVQFNVIDLYAVYEQVALQEKEEQQFKELKKLIGTFLTLFKSNGFTEKDFKRMEDGISSIEIPFLKERTHLFLSIVKPIYSIYQENLKKQISIDFNDMINNATQLVTTRQPDSIKYKYIIIDEFQDISMGRYRLVKAIKDLTAAKVMAVGDDWQSVYRFSGSDLELFIHFEKYFGFTETLRIERTYRNSQQLINKAANFVMSNPRQLKKNLISSKTQSNPIEIYGYAADVMGAFSKAVNHIVSKNGTKTGIMVIGRNNADFKYLFANDSQKQFSYSDKKEGHSLKSKKYSTVKFQLLTAHRSKGLEADNVIVINLRNHLIGFPNKIADDPLLTLVLTDADQYLYAEERRTFYVALTRTKNKTYLIAPQYETSVFVEELIQKHSIPFYLVTNEDSIRKNPKCPHCSTGHLILRTNPKDNSYFLGCTNYPSCAQTFKEIDILKKPLKCMKCEGYMVKRKGPRGDFYGCSNYPLCKNSLSIREADYDYELPFPEVKI